MSALQLRFCLFCECVKPADASQRRPSPPIPPDALVPLESAGQPTFPLCGLRSLTSTVAGLHCQTFSSLWRSRIILIRVMSMMPGLIKVMGVIMTGIITQLAMEAIISIAV